MKEEVQLLESTLDMARIAIEEKDKTIQNLKIFISNSLETQREPKIAKNKQKCQRNSSVWVMIHIWVDYFILSG